METVAVKIYKEPARVSVALATGSSRIVCPRLRGRFSRKRDQSVLNVVVK